MLKKQNVSRYYYEKIPDAEKCVLHFKYTYFDIGLNWRGKRKSIFKSYFLKTINMNYSNNYVHNK